MLQVFLMSAVNKLTFICKCFIYDRIVSFIAET